MNKDRFHFSFRARPAVPRVTDVLVSAADMPAGLSGKRALFITDTHWTDPREAFFSWCGEWMERLRPDIVFWGGDFVEKGACEPFFRGLSGLSAPLGMWAVMGNNDWESCPGDPEAFRRLCALGGIRLLRNQSVRVPPEGGGFLLIGLDEPKYGKPDASLLNQRSPSDEFRILLCHSPLALDSLLDAYPLPSLILCGHTHGGQIRLGSLNAYRFGYEHARRLKRFYVDGVHLLGRSTLIVSNGIGMSSLPLRLGAPPEIHLIRFDAAKSAGTDSPGAKKYFGNGRVKP